MQLTIDSGLAALLGALFGALAALGAEWLRASREKTARLNEARRSAYVDLIVRVGQIREDALSQAVHPPTQTNRQTDPLAMEKIAARTQLLGGRGVRRAADRFADEYLEFQRMHDAALSVYAKPIKDADSQERIQARMTLGAQSDTLKACIDALQEALRQEIGNTK